MTSALDPATIASLLKKDATKVQKAQAHKPPNWLTDQDKLNVLLAYSAGHDCVKLRGRWFGVKSRTVLGEPAVYLYPLDGYLVPCGDFRISKLQESEED